ncbi:unnamed protein product [Prorocentrum cordatum]|uniref:Uncharacterized protein n=1 Tax=Prorocentrum cordatum TaxID=2364126 RepID=A0ABN9VZL5_9DINO|nr:unnamed protein product [Polarella glacialis]
MKASRRAARCRYGPKRRDARLATGAPPDADDWLHVCQKPGSEGGTQVEPIVWEEWRAEREGETYDYEIDDPELTSLVKTDVQNLRSYFRDAPKRRVVPEGTAPLELWHMCLFPRWRMQQEIGVGASEGPPDNKTRWFLLHVGLLKIRRHSITPLYWHRSQAAALPKSLMVGPLGKRVVHWGDIRADLSLIKCADDLNMVILADFGTSLEGFLGEIRLSDEILNEKLALFGLGQNMSNQQLLFHFSRLSHTCKKILRGHPRLAEGTPKDEARYPGPFLVQRESAAHEIGERLQVLNYWKVAPSEVEMAVRRLGMYQGWAKDPESSGQAQAERKPKHFKQSSQGDTAPRMLVNTMARLVLGDSPEIAAMAACVFLKVELLMGSGLAAACLKAGKPCDDDSRALKERAKEGGDEAGRATREDMLARGPPHLHILFRDLRESKINNIGMNELSRSRGMFRIKTVKKIEGGPQKAIIRFSFHREMEELVDEATADGYRLRPVYHHQKIGFVVSDFNAKTRICLAEYPRARSTGRTTSARAGYTITTSTSSPRWATWSSSRRLES